MRIIPNTSGDLSRVATALPNHAYTPGPGPTALKIAQELEMQALLLEDDRLLELAEEAIDYLRGKLELRPRGI